jgi:hypothetical protein
MEGSWCPEVGQESTWASGPTAEEPAKSMVAATAGAGCTDCCWRGAPRKESMGGAGPGAGPRAYPGAGPGANPETGSGGAGPAGGNGCWGRYPMVCGLIMRLLAKGAQPVKSEPAVGLGLGLGPHCCWKGILMAADLTMASETGSTPRTAKRFGTLLRVPLSPRGNCTMGSPEAWRRYHSSENLRGRPYRAKKTSSFTLSPSFVT